MSHSNLLLRRAIASALALSCAMAATASWAEGSPSPAANTLDAVIVTAQKREQNIQDVPIVVTAVSQQMMKDAGVTDIKSLTILTPGLTVTSTGSEASTTARIRGIGTVGDNPGLESSVGIVIDGVYRPRNGVGFGNLGELDHIEVLKGPQGTLFGKNNDAGVINIVTKKPSKNGFESIAEATLGNFNDREVSASINSPVGDVGALRVYAGYGKRDGVLDENPSYGPSTSTKANDRNFYTVRGQFLLSPSDDVSLLLIGDYTKHNEACCGAVQIKNGPFQVPVLNGIASAHGGAGVSTVSPLDPYALQAFANRPLVQRIRDMGISAELNWNLGAAKLTSITAWRDWTYSGGNDVDYSGLDLIYNPTDGRNGNDFKQFSEELRVAGDAGPLNWLFGGFYANETLSPRSSVLAGNELATYINTVGGATAALGGPVPGLPIVGGVSGSQDSYQQTSKSYALFTNETYTITDGLNLIAGLRYTKESKDMTANYYSADGGAGCLAILANGTTNPFVKGYGCTSIFSPAFANFSNTQSRDESNVSGTVKLSYRFADQVMTYISYARGYKAGGFNLDRVASPSTPVAPATPLGPLTANRDTHFDSETVDSYELGIKTTLADKTVHLNAAVFDQKYKDFQLNTFTGIIFVVTSLPAVESKGVDLDMAWATPLTGLSLQGGVTYAFTNINDFGSNLYVFCDHTNTTGCTTQRLNDRISFAPLWSGTLSATYDVPLTGSLSLRTNLSEKYSSSYNTGSNLDPNKLQKSFGLLNARIGVGAPDNKWTVELWAQNLANKGYYQVAFDAPFQYQTLDAFMGDPRTFGVTARVKF